jgi:hypothetical protein
LNSNLLASGVLCLVCPLAHSQAAQPTPSPPEREIRWRQDIQFLVDGLRGIGHTVDLRRTAATQGQIDFAKLYPPGPFNSALGSLNADIPRTSDAEIVLQLMRLMASARVAHNTVRFPIGLGFFARLPFEFHWYSDGLAVIKAAPEYSTALGARVLSMGGMSPEQLLRDFAPYISHENDAWLREQSPEFFRSGAVFRHFDLTGPDGRVSLSLQRADGTPFTLSVAPADPRGTRLDVEEALHISSPLFRSSPGAYYWYRYLADSQTLYIQYNRCENDPKLPFAGFARQALAEGDAHRLQRVVVDLRLNGGGDSTIVGPLKDGLASRLKKIGRVYVLVGPRTFSSAVMNAAELRKSLRAVLVGEPTGGKPDGYGEIKLLTLPNSKLVVQYTTKLLGSHDGRPNGLEPDLTAPITIADALSGSDPGLEAAIAGDFANPRRR